MLRYSLPWVPWGVGRLGGESRKSLCDRAEAASQ